MSSSSHSRRKFLVHFTAAAGVVLAALFCLCGNISLAQVQTGEGKSTFSSSQKPVMEPIKTDTPNVVTQDGKQAGERIVLTVKGVEYPFRWCPAGTFTKGSPESEPGRSSDETQHEVRLTQGFWMLETQVTQEMWESVTGENPSYFKDSKKLPVEQVSWNDCQEYIKKLNAMNSAPKGYKFSLPTEAQWEYACRAGTKTALNHGKNLTDEEYNCPNLYEVGWYDWQNKETKTHEVGGKKPNAWNLYDMHGNVWEWCSDWYGDYRVMDPVGPSTGSDRVLRGGGWSNFAEGCRSASRYYYGPSYRSYDVGLRLSLVREK